MNDVRNRNARVTMGVAKAAGALVAVLAGYLLAGLVGGAIPVNAGWSPPPAGVTIWVESNGIHTGIVVPKVAAGIDWRRLARPEHLADPRYAGHDHLAWGWGDRDFYLATPTWWDVRPRTVLAAAVGNDDTLVHLDHLARPRPGDGARPIVLTPAQYRRLAAFLAAGVRRDPHHYRGYADYDVFYDAHGRYSAIVTCNAWVGRALAQAGVRVGAWTPFPWTVMWWF